MLRIHCNLHSCSRWDSGYALFAMDRNGGVEDFLSFSAAEQYGDLAARWDNVQLFALGIHGTDDQCDDHQFERRWIECADSRAGCAVE